jgi:hypothetical protein
MSSNLIFLNEVDRGGHLRGTGALGEVAGYKDNVLLSALIPLKYPERDGAIEPARFHDAFAADLPPERAALMAATQQPAGAADVILIAAAEVGKTS